MCLAFTYKSRLEHRTAGLGDGIAAVLFVFVLESRRKRLKQRIVSLVGSITSSGNRGYFIGCYCSCIQSKKILRREPIPELINTVTLLE